MSIPKNDQQAPDARHEPGTRDDGEAMSPADAENRPADKPSFSPPGSRRVRPESEKYTGQAPPEDIDGGPSTEGVDFGADVSPEERRRREDEFERTDEGF